MSLVLSNAFKGLLLSSYANIRFDLAVKSFEDLIDKPKVGIYQDDIYDNIKINITEIIQPKRNFEKINPRKMFYIEDEINQFRYGQAIIICVSYNCRILQLFNLHLHLINTEDQRYQALAVKKSHSHSKQILKL